MRIQLVSDLHLEFPASGGTLKLENVDNKTDILILAGDICVSRKIKEFAPFFQHCADTFPQIIYIPGNHEFYHGDIEESHAQIEECIAAYPTISYLNQDILDLGTHYIYGATLWTDCNKGDPITMNALRSCMNDYRLISWKAREHWKLRPQDTCEIHRESVDTLRRHLDDPLYADKPTVVITHHAPSKRSRHPRYANDPYMNGGYQSDLEDIFMLPAGKHDIPLWVHGHTHDSFDYTIGRTRIVCNPRGYVTNFHHDGENPHFNPNLVLEIP